MAPRSTSRDVQGLFSFPAGFESFCVIMSVPLKDAVGRAPVTGVKSWRECNATQFAILWSYSNATYWQKLQGTLLCAASVFSVSPWLIEFAVKLTTETQRTQRLHREEMQSASELPTQRGAHAEVVLVGSHRWLAVEVFVNVKSPPKILHDFYSQVGSSLQTHASGCGQTRKQAEARSYVSSIKAKGYEVSACDCICVRSPRPPNRFGIMFTRAGDAAKKRESRVFCLHHVSPNQTTDGRAQVETLLIAVKQIEKSPNVPATRQLLSIVESELIAGKAVS